VESELPRFLDPCEKLDCALLAHPIDGEVKPTAAAGTWEYTRAHYTIKQLGFNAWNTPETKRKSRQDIDLLIRIGASMPEVATKLKDYIAENHEYSSFYRSTVGCYRDQKWVREIL
jgi:hypothetical protein